jgi:enamine deaminase RidA (YjgF/YER057c/UK114 family)
VVKYDGIVHAYARAPIGTSDSDIAPPCAFEHPGVEERGGDDPVSDGGGLGALRLDPGAVMTFDLALPAPNVPVGSYVMAVRTGDLMFLSGHGAFEDGRPVHTGRLGETMTSEQGARAAETVMLNLLATIRAELGDLSRVARVVKVVVFVNSAPDFTEQHLVANGATDLLARVFGGAGRPARSAVGVAALPLGFAVEIEAIVEVG